MIEGGGKGGRWGYFIKERSFKTGEEMKRADLRGTKIWDYSLKWKNVFGFGLWVCGRRGQILDTK